MKSSIVIISLILLSLVLFWSSTASAKGGHHNGGKHHSGKHHYGRHHYYGRRHYRPRFYTGLYFGYPLINYSYTYSPPTRVIREIEEPVVYVKKPVVYIEKPIKYDEPEEVVDLIESEASNYWYYCKNPAGYYPQVERCPDGWMQVVPSQPKN